MASDHHAPSQKPGNERRRDSPRRVVARQDQPAGHAAAADVDHHGLRRGLEEGDRVEDDEEEADDVQDEHPGRQPTIR